MIKTYVVFDLETTGLDVENDNIIEIGAIEGKRRKSNRPLYGVSETGYADFPYDYRNYRNYE